MHLDQALTKPARTTGQETMSDSERFQDWGVLLMNLGTPDSTEVGDVRRYLREFLSDPRVLDINPLLRAFLLNVIILPFRPAKSAASYRKIWTAEGSPLLVYGHRVREEVEAGLGGRIQVELAMRYGNPSVADALKRFADAGIDRVVLLPLFPQYSSAAFGSAVEKVYQEASKLWDIPSVHVVPPFYDDAGFIEAFAQVAESQLAAFEPDLVLMSFHGVPERHCTKSDASGEHCLKKEGCCDAIIHANRNCYRAQCFATARALATRLNIPDDGYRVTFQSRLGRDPWIQPYTDEITEELAREGVKRLAVMSPAFVADCLETIEELGMELREDFKEAGGEDLLLVDSLNDSPGWIEAILSMLKRGTPIGAQLAGSEAPHPPTAASAE